MESPELRGLPKMCGEGRLKVEPAREKTVLLEEELAGRDEAKEALLNGGRDEDPW